MNLNKISELYEETLARYGVDREKEEPVGAFLFKKKQDQKKEIILNFKIGKVGALPGLIDSLLHREKGLYSWGVFGAVGTFKLGSIHLDPKTHAIVGRKRENLERILCLGFDLDMKSVPELQARFGKNPDDVRRHLEAMDDKELVPLQKKFVKRVVAVFKKMGVPYTQIIMSGYGCYVIIDIRRENQHMIAELHSLNRRIHAQIQKTAGFALADEAVKDSGTRILRLVGSENIKNPDKPRLVTVARNNGNAAFSYKELSSLVPGSHHDGGYSAREDETLFEDREDEPAWDAYTKDEWDKLEPEAVRILAKYYKKGTRGDLGHAVSGILAKAYVKIEQTISLFKSLCKETNEELDRTQMNRIKSTYDKMAAGPGDTVIGYQGLKEIFLREGGEDEGAADLEIFVQLFRESFRASLPDQWSVPDFALEVFPLKLQTYFKQVAKCMEAPVDFGANYFLATAGAMLGTDAGFELKQGWVEQPRLVTVSVGLPGSRKSPVLRRIVAPLETIQKRLELEYHEELAKYRIAQMEFDELIRLAKKPTDEGRAAALELRDRYATNDVPEEPKFKTLAPTDTTIEALGVAMEANQKGILLKLDELSSWTRSMNQYKNKGSDRQIWLLILSGETIRIIRVHMKEPRTVREPFCNVSGGLTPDVIADLKEESGREDGFVHRLLFSYPKKGFKIRFR